MLNIDSSWDRITGMFEITKIVQSNPMFMSGFIANDVETAGYLLDKGLRLAFFTASARDPRAPELISRLPRTRVGVTSILSTATAQSIVDTVETFYKSCAHFVFRLVYQRACHFLVISLFGLFVGFQVMLPLQQQLLLWKRPKQFHLIDTSKYTSYQTTRPLKMRHQ